jgi:hypothetical protein
MKSDFTIVDGIYLVQHSHELDLHNNFDFTGLEYSVANRTLVLNWMRSDGDRVASETPSSVTVTFRKVSECRVLPRDGEMPFTEDDCLSSFGYWTDEDWADGVMILGPDQTPDPNWLAAVDFMSGAVILVQAETAHAEMEA